MKKLIFSLIVLLAYPSLVSAEAFYGFMDNKFYDISGDLQVLCFMDKSCFTLEGQQIWNVNGEFTTKQPENTSITTSTPITVTPVSPTSSVTVTPEPRTVTIQPAPSTPVQPPVSATDTTGPVISRFNFNNGKTKGEFQVNEQFSSVRLLVGVWDLEKNRYVPTDTEIAITVTYYKNLCGVGDLVGGSCNLESTVGKEFAKYGELYYISINNPADGGTVFLEVTDTAGNKTVTTSWVNI